LACLRWNCGTDRMLAWQMLVLEFLGTMCIYTLFAIPK